MPRKKLSEYDKIVGKWILTINGEKISIEFLEGGTFNCYSKNSTFQKLFLFSEEFDQKFHLYNTPKLSPTWELKNGKIKILVSNNEQNYNYEFSNNNFNLTLIKDETKESLTFQKDETGVNIGSAVSSYLKISIIFVIAYFLLLFSLFFLFSLFELDGKYLVIITWGMVVFVGIAMYFVWRKVILPKFK